MKLTLLFILLTIQSFAQVITSSNTKADLALIEKTWKQNNRMVSSEMRSLFPIDRINGQEYVSFTGVVNEPFSEAEFEARGIDIGSRINNIVSIKYPLEDISNILSEVGFKSIEIAGKVKPLLDKVQIGTRADSIWAGYGLPQGYSGKDVIIGITDWGFDYSSPMFYDTLLQNTRILAAWDQFKNSGPAPSGYNYGAEYSTPTEFDATGADTANFYSYATHGTHVAGIAGGSGAGKKYRGMAFESEFLFVTFLFNEGAVLDAWQWMYDKAQAEGKRLVINMSWGIYHSTAIDGTSTLSQALDAYSDLGVVFVTSAGNNGDVNFHIEKDFANDTLKSRVDFYTNPGLTTLWGQSIHAWGQSGNEVSAGVQILNLSNQLVAESPLYSTATTTSYVDSFVVAGADTFWYNLSADAAYPSNGRPQIRLRLKKPSSSSYRVVLKSTGTGKVHYWNLTELSTDVGNWGMPFHSLGAGYTAGNNQFGIGSPACSNKAISVAAYTSEYRTITGTEVGGQGASFTSIGPLMNDSLKPDISAPGVQVASSISSYTDNSYAQMDFVDFNGRTYPFARFSGTSMSSPACAGIVAMILEANPYLSSDQVKSILIETARTDSYTGAIPPHSTQWGWGKVNGLAAVQLALTVTGIEEIPATPNWSLAPNPANDIITIIGLEGTPDQIQVISMSGQMVFDKAQDTTTVSIGTLDPGVYFLRIVKEGKVEQVRFIKE